MAGDAQSGGKIGRPVGVGEGVGEGEDLDGAVFLAGASPRPAPADVDGGLGIGQATDSVEKRWLVLLELDEQMVTAGPCRLECFFDSAWRPG